MVGLDKFDLKLLVALQEDASQTNQELGEVIHLSASQVSRRRARLEQERVIRRYKADLSPEYLGLDVMAFIGVALATHNKENARLFRDLVRTIPSVQEAYAMTGDMDYMLKIRVKDLKALSVVINNDLLPHEAVQNVRSSIAMDTLRDDNHLPLRYQVT